MPATSPATYARSSFCIDRESVQNGAAASGAPWQYFDLGHGHCTYSFFEQCPHRMACARCDFYLPKHSARGQLLEAQATCNGCWRRFH